MTLISISVFKTVLSVLFSINEFLKKILDYNVSKSRATSCNHRVDIIVDLIFCCDGARECASPMIAISLFLVWLKEWPKRTFNHN